MLIKHNYNSIKLIDFSIKLDHNNSFPVKDMKTLKEEINKNPLSFNVMRKLIVNHLYMFPTRIETRQTIFSTMNISMEAQRKIEHTTQQKKKK